MQTTQPKQRCLIVEGNIGAGKSTFLAMLGRYLNTQLVFEPHEQWQNVGDENLLDHFYKDTQRWAYTFQSYAFVTRVKAQEEHSKINTRPLQILERSVFSDRYCFARNSFDLGYMSSLEWQLYQEWFSWLVDSYTTKPDAFIYLRTDPTVCYERLVKRNRSEEKNVPLDYIQLLHKKHEDWLLHKKDVAPYLQNVPVLVLECNNDFEHSIAEQHKHIKSIVQFIEKEFKLAPKTSLVHPNTITW